MVCKTTPHAWVPCCGFSLWRRNKVEPRESLFQASKQAVASSTTSFKTNFVGIESWANFVTAKEETL